MKRLFVGCRVRILWSYAWPELGGQEGRCIEPRVAVEGPAAGELGWAVAPDCWGSEIAPDYSGSFCPMPDQLEPIQDPGHQVVSWEACLWQPEGMPA